MQNEDLLIKFKTMFIVCFPYNPHFDGLIVQSSNNGAATRENRSSGFPTRSDTNRAVQAQKQARSLKFRI